MKIVLKNTPKLKLIDLLRRRKMSLKTLCTEFGITTYEGLVIRCNRMGVAEVPEEEFNAAVGTLRVTSPTEGVVVLEPLPPPEFDAEEFEEVVYDEFAPLPTEPPQKKRRKKKEDNTLS